LLVFCLMLCCSAGHAVNVTWFPFGPDGGDARGFAAEPRVPAHLYLGAANGWMFESRDAGKSWKRLAQVGNRDDLVLDNIVVDVMDARHIVVGAWVVGRPDGGLYVSRDAGVTWTSNPAMAGQKILALTASASDPKTMVAGTLEGIFRSVDGGTSWVQISEAGSKELHEVESIAIDPSNPKIIYAGTWHLPWKTTDGGKHWNNIKEGVIEDSDVFSIIVDPKASNVVYASACSGIYKSENGGERFTKIQGIPSTARRTRVLMQDPNHLETVYAGTTEGLFRTDDSGATWVRTTGPELIVNDVYVDPADSNHVLLATDRSGVLSSHDRGNSFDSANSGFSARQITSYVAEAGRPANVYVGVVNDKGWGGVFASDNGGLSWVQESAGLGGRDVFSLGQASDGTILAGTGHGIYRLHGAMWTRAGEPRSGEATVPEPVKFVPKKTGAAGRNATASHHGSVGGTGAAQVKAIAAETAAFDGSVYSIAAVGDMLFAATSEGLLESRSAGETWSHVPGVNAQELLFVSVVKRVIVASGLKSAISSVDGGKTWAEMKLPEDLTQIAAVAVDDTGAIWLGGREGVFVSTDQAATWRPIKKLAIREVNSIFYDSASERVLITAGGKNTMVFAVHVPDLSVQYWETGWKLRFARPVGDHLIAATPFDGIVVQPRMVDSSLVGKR
jgi:photosystem II stability/assembly factor-like uncharacterized protein